VVSARIARSGERVAAELKLIPLTPNGVVNPTHIRKRTPKLVTLPSRAGKL
jgi:hypothetical protein